VRVWRITRSVYAAYPLSGEGAARAGNRWNSRGVRVGYTSSSRPLAVLEMLVHVTREGVPDDIVLIPIDVPSALIAELDTPPKDWNVLPFGEPGRHAGDNWAREKKSAALLVPSVVLPAERNLLINPLHPDFSKVRIHTPERHAIDRRLLR
jgi:RES domain-containing protein